MQAATRWTRRWAIWGMVCGLSAAACLPIPIPSSVDAQPAGEIKVVDGQGAGISGAQVWVAWEEGPPHPQPGALARWTHTADAQGVVKTKQEQRRVTQMPLMMHGVKFYKHRVCAEAPGYVARAEEWRPEPGVAATLVLEAGSGEGCAALMPMQAPKD